MRGWPQSRRDKQATRTNDHPKGLRCPVPGDQRASDFEVRALSFLDLRFSDGHVERWLGPDSLSPIRDGR
jgi:hypothetical protein